MVSQKNVIFTIQSLSGKRRFFQRMVDMKLKRCFLAVILTSCSSGQKIYETARIPNTQESTAFLEWKNYAGDLGASKFSEGNLINKSNARFLKTAWSVMSPDNSIVTATGTKVQINQSTPIMANGNLYATTALNQVISIQPATGEILWTYNNDILSRNANPPNSGFVSRGLSYWQKDDEKRLLMGTGDYYLVSLDASTGLPSAGFGENGVVDLMKTIRTKSERHFIGVTSPPVICGDVVIVGSSIADYALKKKNIPAGDVQAFDVRSGKYLWSFRTIPQLVDFGVGSWKKGSWKTASGANVWAQMSVDNDLQTVFLPVSTPSDDLYGGNRIGNGLFGESLVSLDCKTGKRRWHYQIVHHGLWDYDLPAAPVLMDIRKDGKVIKAVAQVTKQGFTFVFNRVTGKPIWPIIETAVPQSKIPGEISSPTQPFPTKPVAFDRQGLKDEDLIAFSPQIFEETKKILEQYNYGPLYTPPTLDKPVVTVPGGYGGASWAGAAYSPVTQMLYVPSVTLPLAFGVVADPASEFGYTVNLATSKQLRRPDGLPIVKPPYGRITAINMVTGEHAWMIPSGVGPKSNPSLVGIDLPKEDLGWDRRTHLIVTPELLFAAQAGPFSITGASKLPDGGVNSLSISTTDDDPILKAIDAQTGQEIARANLPGNATGALMTYIYNGKQYIVIPYGGANLPAGFVAVTIDEKIDQ